MLKTIFSKNYISAIYLLVLTANARINRNSFLGSAWGLIQPFIHIFVIATFFSFLLQQKTHTMIFNLVGALPQWNFILNSSLQSSVSLISKENIIKRAIISKSYFPVADVLSNLQQFFLSTAAMYFTVICFYPDHFSFNIFLTPLLALPLIISMSAAGIALAFLTPYIGDIPRLVEVLLSVIYWTIPIIYPYSMIPEDKQIYFEFNPLFILIRPMQQTLAESALVDSVIIAKSWFLAFIIVALCYAIYKRISRNVIYYL